MTMKRRIEALEQRSQEESEGPDTIRITMHRSDGPITVVAGETEHYEQED